MSIVGVATFTSNIIFWMQSGYFDSTSTIKPLIHTWSLAVEEQFYIIIPLLMMVLGLFKRSFLIWVFIGLSFFSLMLSEYASRLYPELNFYMLPTRMWELLAGSIVAIIYHQRNTRVFSSINLNKILSTASLLAVVLCLIFFNHDIRFPSLYAALPVYATALLLITSHPYTLSYKLLSNRLFVLIGLASYSIYLWHQPIFAFTRIFQQTVLSNNDIVLCLIATLLCGFLSWHFIEKPFRNRERFSQKTILIFGVLSLFL
jgi:peptidoglycan/LPS O-acetylase OafA/YrhL